MKPNLKMQELSWVNIIFYLSILKEFNQTDNKIVCDLVKPKDVNKLRWQANVT